MNELKVICISDVDCYENDGTVYLKLENVARGLGFTEIAKSGNECIRWRTVRKYLEDFGIAASCDGEKLPDFNCIFEVNIVDLIKFYSLLL